MKAIFAPTWVILAVFFLVSLADIAALVYQFIPNCTQGICVPLPITAVLHALSLPSMPFIVLYEYGFVAAAPLLMGNGGESALTYALYAFIALKFGIHYLVSCAVVLVYRHTRKTFIGR